MAGLPYALQLYTVRDHLAKDVAGTLAKVKEAGYDHVELAGFGDATPEAYRGMLDAAGLTAVSCHFGIDEACGSPDRVTDACAAFGLRYAVVPYASAEDEAGWLEIARRLDVCGAALRARGIRLCYHNHAHEFTRFSGRYAFDLLYAETKPEHLAAQIDSFWVRHGGEDPAAYIRKYAGRCPLLHVKDRAPEGAKPIFAELGRGTMDWDPIFAAAKAAGVQWYIVEQDEASIDSLEAARISAAFMKGRS